MRKKLTFSGVVGLMLLVCGCSKKQIEIPTFDEAKPYTIEIKRERSFYQAEKIADRLTNMGLGGYVLCDSTENGVWYRVVSGALKDSVEVADYKAKLDTIFHISDVDVVEYTALDSIRRTPIAQAVDTEVSRIAANEPDVPQTMMDVVKKYPKNNMFYLQNITLTQLSGKAIQYSSSMRMDMPRGVTLGFWKKKKCQSFASVIYEDNLYGDNVTLQIVRCEPKVIEQKASILPVLDVNAPNYEAMKICDEAADLVLGTGKYENEQKEYMEVGAYTKLTGYKVSFDEKGKNRKYYILTDEYGEFIYLAQSTKEDDEELLKFLSDIGKSDGLIEYDEFYNTFYTLADGQIGKDELLCYTVDKLDWRYAMEKDYASWAKKMVGHWTASFYLSSDYKVWQYGIFDLLTEGKCKNVYKSDYLRRTDSDNLRTIYGTRGAAIYSWWSGELSEVNFGVERYVVALNPVLGAFSERELVVRAENLQFQKGGYSAMK